MGHTGFFTDTTLCIGCKACEVACKQWNQLPADGYKWTGNSYDNTGHLSATTWRHVAFVEHTRPSDSTGKVVNWDCELGPPNGLMRRGWTRNSLKPGQSVTSSGFRSKLSPVNANARTVKLPDGRQVFAGSSFDTGPTQEETAKK